MKTRWRPCTLGDLFQIKHGFAFKGEYFTDSGTFILLTPGNFRESGGLQHKGDKEKYYKGDFPAEYLLEAGDLLVAMTDLTQEAPILGSPAIIPTSGKYLHNQRLGKVIGVKSDQVSLPFLFYLFNSASVRGQIKGSASGATVRHTSPSRIYEVKARIPDTYIQRKIASILSAYDDLIENNTRRIAILEEMAQAIYREWFVSFRFPGHENVKLVNSPLGKIPEGWKPTRLGDLAKEVRRGVDPSQVDPETPYFGLEHLPRRSITLGEWGKAKDVQSTKLAFEQGEILFGKIRPYFHKVGVAPVNGVCSSDAIVIVPKSALAFGPVISCVSSDDFVRHATQTSQGTKMPRANWEVLVKYPLPTPPDGLLEEFNQIINDVVSQLRVLMLKVRTLRTTRDLLLPKLISGQLDVEELDINVGEATAGADA